MTLLAWILVGIVAYLAVSFPVAMVFGWLLKRASIGRSWS